MAALAIERLRNVILLSHSGAGKTTLSEAMLYTAKTIVRIGRVDEGNTTSDWDPDEIGRKISLNLTLLPFLWKEHKINLLDTPGYIDFVGEVKAGIRVVEGVVVVVCCASGVEVGTELSWRYVEEARLPRLIFVNKVDRENADFERTLDQIRSRLAAKAIPLQLPIGSQADFKGLVDLVSGKAYLGANGTEAPVPAEMASQVAAAREKLVEAAVETDDALIAKYLEGGEIGEAEIRQGLLRGVKQGLIVPVLLGSALHSMGVAFLADAILNYLPSPAEAPVTAAVAGNQQTVNPAPDGSLAALVFKTIADPYVGKLSIFRVYSGTIASNSQVWNASKGQMERVGQLYVIRGKNQETAAAVSAGDMGAVAKLSVTASGDTLSSREHAVQFAPPAFPAPIMRLAVLPKTKADLDKMSLLLPRLMEEDSTLLVQKDQDTGETILCGMGDTHLEVAVERLRRKFGVEVKLQLPRVPYRETITVGTRADYRHKKQTGGHGQFAHVFLEMEPLPRGSGIQFDDKIVGGAISKNFVSATEKGVYEAAQEGVLAGFPVVDVKAKLYDGKEHPVDSSDICFKIAGAYAFRRGMSEGHAVLLEPIMRLRVVVPETMTGDLISDLNIKRARVLGMIPEGETNTIEAQVPLAEAQRYAIDLRSLTQGRGSFTMELSHYEEVPAHISQRIISEKQTERAAERA